MESPQLDRLYHEASQMRLELMRVGNWLILVWWTLVAIGVVLWVWLPSAHAEGRRGLASYDTVASCRREGTSGIMANGRTLDDTQATAASWNYPLGTRVLVQRHDPRRRLRSIVVTVTDRGPSKRLYRQGRILDLSKKAFQALAPLRVGVIPVTVEALPSP